MNSDLFGKVRAAFEQLAPLPAEERARELARLAQSELRVHNAVAPLLEAHDQDQGLLDHPPPLPAFTPEDSGDADPLIGATFGQYTITELLGRGGMGVVYLARQDLPNRSVALKLIRTPYLSPSLLRRFSQESAALARLKHPGIAQVYDAGYADLPGGTPAPYFAMELVRGRSLLAEARATGWSPTDSMQAMADICDAVEHAHQHGVVHRDLKPSNILIEPTDDSSTQGLDASSTSPRRGRPKILDFGVARLTDLDSSLSTLATHTGEIIGTLQYMSPEQVRGENSLVDARADVYALGVIFHELLVGAPPYTISRLSVAEAARVIAEHEPTHLRSSTPTQTRFFRGDIETIVLKALEKDPARRYQSAGAMGADIRRHLAHLPIIARPATTAYQLRKFARRNRALVAGVAATMIVLIGGIIGTSLGLLRANAARLDAEAKERSALLEARRSRHVVDFLVGMLTSADPDVTKGREVSVRELLDRAAADVGQELADDPEVLFTIRTAIGRTYRAIGDPARGSEFLAQAADSVRESPDASTPPKVLQLAELTHQLALAASDREDWVGMRDHAAKALALLEGLAPADDPRLAPICVTLGGAYESMGDLDQADAFARRALTIAKNASATGDIATASGLLASIVTRRGGKDASAEAESLYRLQVDTLSNAHGPQHTRTIDAKAKLAYFLGIIQRDAEAIPLLEEVVAVNTRLFGEAHRRTFDAYSDLATSLVDMGKFEEAQAAADKAIAGLRVAAPRTPALADALGIRGMIASRRKDFEKAVLCHRESLEIRVERQSINAVTSMANLAGALRGAGRLEEALEYSARAIEARRAANTIMTDFGVMLNNHADILGMLGGRDEEAEKYFQDSLAFDREKRPDNPANALNMRTYAVFLCRHGRFEEAERLARQAHAMTTSLSKAQRTRVADALIRALEGLGRNEEADKLRSEFDLPAATPPAPGTAPATPPGQPAQK